MNDRTRSAASSASASASLAVASVIDGRGPANVQNFGGIMLSLGFHQGNGASKLTAAKRVFVQLMGVEPEVVGALTYQTQQRAQEHDARRATNMAADGMAPQRVGVPDDGIQVFRHVREGGVPNASITPMMTNVGTAVVQGLLVLGDVRVLVKANGKVVLNVRFDKDPTKKGDYTDGQLANILRLFGSAIFPFVNIWDNTNREGGLITVNVPYSDTLQVRQRSDRQFGDRSTPPEVSYAARDITIDVTTAQCQIVPNADAIAHANVQDRRDNGRW